MRMQGPICFFGHHRSASTYASNIFKILCRELNWHYLVAHTHDDLEKHLSHDPAQRAPDVLILTNAEQQSLQHLANFKGVHIIRDPRDVVVSSYFSHLYSHPTDQWPELVPHRAELKKLSKDDGLTFEIEHCRAEQFAAMANWNYEDPNILEIRAETLTQDPKTHFASIAKHLNITKPVTGQYAQLSSRLLMSSNRLLRKLQRGEDCNAARLGKRMSGIDQVNLNRIIDEQAFKANAKGRVNGEENRKSHYRKGVAGDWRNHFTETHIERFKTLYNPLLVKLGYEQDGDW